MVFLIGLLTVWALHMHSVYRLSVLFKVHNWLKIAQSETIYFTYQHPPDFLNNASIFPFFWPSYACLYMVVIILTASLGVRIDRKEREKKS